MFAVWSYPHRRKVDVVFRATPNLGARLMRLPHRMRRVRLGSPNAHVIARLT